MPTTPCPPAVQPAVQPAVEPAVEPVDPRDRGDVPGWVLVTLMTAGLVVALWAVAGPRFEAVFTQAMDAVVGQL